MRKKILITVAAAAFLAAPALAAAWTVMAAGQPEAVAKSGLTVTPKSDWNRWSARPSPKGETWTQDGVALNQLDFFAAIAPGEALYKEHNKKDQPLPKFDAKMTAPDIVRMFEDSNRILLKTSLFEIDKVEPTRLAGHDGVLFRYHYVVEEEEVRRNGEARAAIVGGKLYLINFAAPAIYYYDAGIGEAEGMMDHARL